MRIEELVLEGFKSYPVRTQITGWDPSFNAITGLNGSGKSNILDAICFVLGMTNVSQMRASNLQDLIYKRGQAGVTKASVTVVFDNSDRSTSPVGFENCRQITVTRQIAIPNVSKYLLNGHKTQQHIVQTLFQSVQLNINNPHFLIMQGRITKVLNMRPQEILGMVEEAAGTRMFEERKDKAKKTMDKKEKRVQEITSLLEEEITPKLDKLRADKRSFLAYQQATTEIERLGRVVRAWEWKEANDRVKRKEVDIEKREKEIGKLGGEKKSREEEALVAEKQKKEAEKKRENELKKGGKFKAREEEVKASEMEMVKLKAQAEIRQSSVEEEEKRVQGCDTELKELEDSLVAKRLQLEDFKASHASVAEQHATSQSSLTKSEELLQSLLTGLSNTSGASGGNGGGYLGQLADAKARLARETAEEEQLRKKLNMKEKELLGLTSRWKQVEAEANTMKKSLEQGRSEVETLKEGLEKVGWDDAKEKEASEELSVAKLTVRSLSEQHDSLRRQLSALEFPYADPYPNFDRSTVKGLVATLVSLHPSHFDKSTALEIAAGGRLYNVVVQNEQVGKSLLENGKLKKRVTIIPLNKINAFKASAAKLQAVNQSVGDKANLALTLVGYEKDVSSAMAYVFGDTLICSNATSAKAVTFDPQIQMKSVTLDGDVYDPSGTLSGGAAPSSSGLLVKVQEMKDVLTKLNAAKSELEILQKEEAKMMNVKQKWKEQSRALAIKEHEVGLLSEQVEGSNAVRVGASVDETKRNIEILQESIKSSVSKQDDAKRECKQLENDMHDFKNNKEGKITELKASISKQKSELQKHAVVVKTHQKEMQTSYLELEQLQHDIVMAKKTCEDTRKGLAKIQKELDSIKKELLSLEERHRAAENKLRQERAALTRFDDEISELDDVIKLKEQAVSEIELSIKKVGHEVQNLHKERAAAANAITTLEKAFEWIVEEKKHFGKEGSPYDFKTINVQQAREKCGQLENQMKGMKKTINKAVMGMLEMVEKKEAALKKMLTTVLRDKVKIEETIAELDHYKRDALQKTWEKVNGDFGSIFTELLPGNFAKLQPPEGQDLTQGLEVKVQLGSVWKQSLTELSGGQRSLIALSLIMSLLQFKPAPMYILDEIDAALDLSHTQHIGQLFRTRFKGSQFIVVSLKEGLFTNANVLFRARFVDGTSVVQRTAQRSGSTLYTSHDSGNKENLSGSGVLETPKARPGKRVAVQ